MTVPTVLMSDDEVARYGRNPDAGFGALSTPQGALPLVAMDVDARVAGVIAAIAVSQTFVNTTGHAIEATYIFPLPDRAAVHKFQMTVGGRVIDGVIDERGAARERYDEAIAAGHRAAITEEDRPGVFTLRVGNLMPGESATVALSLVGPLPIDDGEVTFRFPLVVAPRYVPGAPLAGEQAGLGIAADTDLVPDASRISPPVRLPGMPNPVRLAVRIAIEDAAVRELASSLHAVLVSKRDAQVVELRPGERLDRDVIVRWKIDGSALRSQLVCADDEAGDGGTFALTIVPPSTTAVAAKPRDVVFVIDRSGSMEGWKMVAARRAAARMIDTLTSRDRFGAILFDNQIEVLSDSLVEATDRQRFRAVELLAKVDSRGGTELAEPLRRAFAMLASRTLDRERTVVLVTDGQVGNEDHILAEIAPLLRGSKMFTLGIDQAVNAAFLRRLAAAGGGLCELVESEDRLDAVMAKVHRRIGTPIATELSLRATGFSGDASRPDAGPYRASDTVRGDGIVVGSLAPAKLPDVYAGAPVVVLGRYRGTASPAAAIAVEGTSLGEPLRLTAVRATASEVTGSTSWLAASWARAHLRDLEDRYAASPDDSLAGKIATVSKQFGVLSRFTAFLAVDRSAAVNPGGALYQVVQPVEPVRPPAAPGGWTTAVAGGITRVMSVAPRPAAPMFAAPSAAQMLEVGKVRSRALLAGVPSRTMVASLGEAAGAPPDGGALEGTRGSSDGQGVSPDGGLLDAPYRAELTKLAQELETSAGGDANAIRLVRQRIEQWLEDVRTMGGLDELADAVAALVQRLSAVLVAGANLAVEVTAVAQDLLALGDAPEPSPPPKKKSRFAFWK